MDLVGDVEESGWLVVVQAVAAADRPGYLEAPVAARAIAASELAAAALGHPLQRMPDVDMNAPEVAEVLRFSDFARRVLGRIRMTSELHELWDEAGQLSAWEVSLDDLLNRLGRQPSRRPAAKAARVRLVEGTCFAVPLPSGGFAIGVLSQLIAGKMPYGYFCGPRRSSAPEPEDLVKLKPSDAVLRVKFGETEIHNGRWQNLGRLSQWTPEAWPTPPHTSGDAGPGMVWRVEYPRNAPKSDPATVVRIHAEQAQALGPDIVMGALAVERELDQKL